MATYRLMRWENGYAQKISEFKDVDSVIQEKGLLHLKNGGTPAIESYLVGLVVLDTMSWLVVVDPLFPE